MEGFKQPEIISEEYVISELNSKGIEDAETKRLLEKYVDQCNTEADAEASADPENPEASNRANIKSQIKIAVLYSKTEKYKAEALESLGDAYNAASQQSSTQDLAKHIDGLIANLSLL